MCFRVEQQQGDVIVLGPGTVFWMFSVGWCTQVTYRTAPATESQFAVLVQADEYNRTKVGH